MSQILYIDILVDRSLSGIMTSKLVIRESESPRPVASSILISRMTSPSVIIHHCCTMLTFLSISLVCNIILDMRCFVFE